MKFVVFGLNHRTAPLEVREGWALSFKETPCALEHLSGAVIPSEHFVLSTCNRTEFYSHLPKKFVPASLCEPELDVDPVIAYADFYRQAYGEFLKARPSIMGTLDASHYYVHIEDNAVEHFFRLASGLDSMILGESQILKQIKDAFQVAKEANTTGKFLHRLIPSALRTGKRVRTTTAISTGCITPGQAALNLARATLSDLSGKSFLVVGSGKIATSTARAFRDSSQSKFLMVNRTAAHARELVEKIGCGTVAPWETLLACLERADVVVSSTGAVEPIVTREAISRIQAARGHRPLVIVDLAIPRDFEPGCGDVEGVSLFNIDDLNRIIQENVAERLQHLPLAERIVREEMSVFQQAQMYLQIDPVLRHMMERFEQIRLGELQSCISQFPVEYHDLLKQMTSSLVKKLLHFPIEKLKSLRDFRGLDEREVSFLKRLFLTDV